MKLNNAEGAAPILTPRTFVCFKLFVDSYFDLMDMKLWLWRSELCSWANYRFTPHLSNSDNIRRKVDIQCLDIVNHHVYTIPNLEEI